MKLYNIYESIIIEEIGLDGKGDKLGDNAKLEPETLNVRDAILAAIDGKYNIWFKYNEDDGTITERYVQVYPLGLTRLDNEAINVYQIGGETNKSKPNNTNYGFKSFRLDKIVPGSVTKYGKGKGGIMKFNKPISDLPSYGAGPKYNPNPDTTSPTRIFNKVITKPNFNK